MNEWKKGTPRILKLLFQAIAKASKDAKEQVARIKKMKGKNGE